MNIRKLIEDYLAQAKLMQVATVKEQQPWACSVYFAYDEKLNFYWLSKPSCRHSEELRNNKNLAGTIVLPHTPGDKVQGIQFQGIATELSNKDDVNNGMNYYAKRYGMKQDRVQKIVENTDGHLCYKITPKLLVLFDELHFPDNPRQEYIPS